MIYIVAFLACSLAWGVWITGLVSLPISLCLLAFIIGVFGKHSLWGLAILVLVTVVLIKFFPDTFHHMNLNPPHEMHMVPPPAKGRVIV